MPAIARLSRNELAEMIETVEAEGGDATELKNLLAQVDEDARLKQPARRRHFSPSVLREEEEPTTEQRLEAEVGELFPGGIITAEILAECMDMDYKYSLKELRKMCRDAGLGLSGAKKELAAKLIARGINNGVPRK